MRRAVTIAGPRGAPQFYLRTATSATLSSFAWNRAGMNFSVRDPVRIAGSDETIQFVRGLDRSTVDPLCSAADVTGAARFMADMTQREVTSTDVTAEWATTSRARSLAGIRRAEETGRSSPSTAALQIPCHPYARFRPILNGISLGSRRSRWCGPPTQQQVGIYSAGLRNRGGLSGHCLSGRSTPVTVRPVHHHQTVCGEPGCRHAGRSGVLLRWTTRFALYR